MTDVKICGLSSAATMTAALDAGADHVGLVFFRPSPRNLSLDAAAGLAHLARGRARIVALTVDADDDQLSAIGRIVKPDFLQAHGKESPARLAEIRTLTGAGIIKAIGIATANDVRKADAYASADLILFDAKAEAMAAVLPGGNGIAFDWTLLGKDRRNFMLAGGLTPENVADAIRITGAPFVDVSSGVESAPGVKDITKIRKFIEAAKAAS